MSGRYAQAASLPDIHRETGLVIAGFGNEKPNAANGTLNEVINPAVSNGCSTKQALCTYVKSHMCWGDSGLGAVESRPRPTVIGILSDMDGAPCGTDLDYYASLTEPAAVRFIRTTKSAPAPAPPKHAQYPSADQRAFMRACLPGAPRVVQNAQATNYCNMALRCDERALTFKQFVARARDDYLKLPNPYHVVVLDYFRTAETTLRRS